MQIRIEVNDVAPPPAKKYVGWRCLHKTEGGRDIPQTVNLPNPPAVVPPYNPTIKLKMTEAIQRLSYDLMRHFCPGLTPSRWRTMHSDGLAMCNGFGYDAKKDPVPRRDYINKRDLNVADWPYYDKMQRTFQGSFLRGTLRDDLIYCNPGIDAIDARNFSYVPGTPEAAELLQTVIDKAWYSIAVNVGNPPFHFRPTWGGFIAYPFILDRQVTFEAKFFESWESDELPDPLRIYNPL